MIAEKELVERISAYRREHNLSVSEFAILCGLTRQTISHVEAGKNIRLSTRILIEQALGISADDCNKLIAQYTSRSRRLNRAAYADYYQRNRDRIRAYQRQYLRDDRARNPEKYREIDRMKRERYRDRIRAYNTEYQRQRRARLKATADQCEASAKLESNGSAAPVPSISDD